MGPSLSDHSDHSQPLGRKEQQNHRLDRWENTGKRTASLLAASAMQGSRNSSHNCQSSVGGEREQKEGWREHRPSCAVTRPSVPAGTRGGEGYYNSTLHSVQSSPLTECPLLKTLCGCHSVVHVCDWLSFFAVVWMGPPFVVM